MHFVLAVAGLASCFVRPCSADELTSGRHNDQQEQRFQQQFQRQSLVRKRNAVRSFSDNTLHSDNQEIRVMRQRHRSAVRVDEHGDAESVQQDDNGMVQPNAEIAVEADIADGQQAILIHQREAGDRIIQVPSTSTKAIIGELIGVLGQEKENLQATSVAVNKMIQQLDDLLDMTRQEHELVKDIPNAGDLATGKGKAVDEAMKKEEKGEKKGIQALLQQEDILFKEARKITGNCKEVSKRICPLQIRMDGVCGNDLFNCLTGDEEQQAMESYSLLELEQHSQIKRNAEFRQYDARAGVSVMAKSSRTPEDRQCITAEKMEVDSPLIMTPCNEHTAAQKFSYSTTADDKCDSKDVFQQGYKFIALQDSVLCVKKHHNDYSLQRCDCQQKLQRWMFNAETSRVESESGDCLKVDGRCQTFGTDPVKAEVDREDTPITDVEEKNTVEEPVAPDTVVQHEDRDLRSAKEQLERLTVALRKQLDSNARMREAAETMERVQDVKSSEGKGAWKDLWGAWQDGGPEKPLSTLLVDNLQSILTMYTSSQAALQEVVKTGGAEPADCSDLGTKPCNDDTGT